MPNVNETHLGPAEMIIQTFLTHADHLYHGRPGMVIQDTTTPIGVKWSPATYIKDAEGKKQVYRLHDKGRGPAVKVTLPNGKTLSVRGSHVGTLWEDNTIRDANRRKLGEYRAPGIFKEVAVWTYRQIAEVWKLDNEFAARWASYIYNDDHRDRKVMLAAFMMVQSRKGDPVLDNGKVSFYDEDFRDVGEAMVLQEGAKYFDAKMLLRVYEVLNLPEIAAINRELGFGNSARTAFLGRLPKATEKWLRYREENPKVLSGLVNKGFRTTVIRLARISRYKPVSPKFFKVLRWKQDQAKDGRRTMAIGETVKAAESWAGLTEEQICERIVQTKPDFKRVVGLLPEEVGLTRAIMAAAIESGSLSDKDLIIYTPTLEELGLLKVPAIQGRWQQAIKAAEDQRAANIALRVKSREAKEGLQEAADMAIQKAVEEVTRNLRVYFFVDVSSSMTNAIDKAKEYIGKFLQGFPIDRLHVAVFNTTGRELSIKHASAAGVNNAFAGIRASGGTSHGSGVRALARYKPREDEDALFIFVGDEEERGTFEGAVLQSGINPVAFGFLKVRHSGFMAVTGTATRLGIPCFLIDERIFEDPYAIPRTIRNLIAATPVGKVSQAETRTRVSLVDTILQTPLLQKPAWAA